MTRYINVDRSHFVTYIKNRVHRHNKNFLSICTGIPGEGKSYSMLRLAEDLDKNFSVDNVILSAQELMQVINSGKLKRGSVLVVDEFGVLHNSRAFQSTENRLVNFLVQTFRRQGFILLGCTPSFGLIDKATRNLLHCHFITCGIDKKKKVVYVKPLLLQPSQREDKTYFKYLRVGGIVPGRLVAVQELEFPLPSKKLREAYEKKRDKFQDKINQDIEEKLKPKEKKKRESFDDLSPILQETYMDWKEGLTIEEMAKKRKTSVGAIKNRRLRLRYKGFLPRRGEK